MRSAESLLGATGLVFGRSQSEILRGDFLGSVAEGLDARNGKNRWRPNGCTAATQIGLLRCSGSAPSKELFVVASDHHSRSKHGNRRY